MTIPRIEMDLPLEAIAAMRAVVKMQLALRIEETLTAQEQRSTSEQTGMLVRHMDSWALLDRPLAHAMDVMMASPEGTPVMLSTLFKVVMTGKDHEDYMWILANGEYKRVLEAARAEAHQLVAAQLPAIVCVARNIDYLKEKFGVEDKDPEVTKPFSFEQLGPKKPMLN